jgi:protein O-GlcNAc transferase
MRLPRQSGPEPRPWASRLTLALALAVLTGSTQSQQPPSKAALEAASTSMREGLAAANRNDLVAARKAFARAVQLAPGLEATHAALGAILLAQSDLPAAVAELQRAHDLAPSDVSATLNLARCQSELGRSSAAIQLFRRALAAPNPPLLSPEESLAFAQSLAAQGAVPEAEQQLSAALARTPDSALLHDALGILLAQSGHADQARQHFQQAISLDPSLTQAQLHLGCSR